MTKIHFLRLSTPQHSQRGPLLGVAPAQAGPELGIDHAEIARHAAYGTAVGVKK